MKLYYVRDLQGETVGVYKTFILEEYKPLVSLCQNMIDPLRRAKVQLESNAHHNKIWFHK